MDNKSLSLMKFYGYFSEIFDLSNFNDYEHFALINENGNNMLSAVFER